jgi:hypothetical protein
VAVGPCGSGSEPAGSVNDWGGADFLTSSVTVSFLKKGTSPWSSSQSFTLLIKPHRRNDSVNCFDYSGVSFI